jgi:hypothetical protein
MYVYNHDLKSWVALKRLNRAHEFIRGIWDLHRSVTDLLVDIMIISCLTLKAIFLYFI